MSLPPYGRERLSETMVVRITPTEAAYLDRMMRQGSFESRASLVRSILRTIMDDERAAGEAA